MLRHPGLMPPNPVLCPHLGQIQFPVQQRPAIGAGVGQKYPDLAVLNPPHRAAVLPLHPGRLVAFLEEAGLINHQHSVSVGQVFHNVVPEVVANQVGVPTVAGQQALHPVRSGVAS